ncbi:hypothetical protein, partial [Streptococcus pneumoniae]|uniref:hypothetical protein n=1 Tax=Streptococcus pneumoniae TaxID=1313 RepID=UPI0012D78014
MQTMKLKIFRDAAEAIAAGKRHEVHEGLDVNEVRLIRDRMAGGEASIDLTMVDAQGRAFVTT